VSAELDANPNQAKPRPGEELVAPVDQVPQRKGKPNPNSAVVWHFDKVKAPAGTRIARGDHMNRTISTACVSEGLCFVPDFSGFLHCFDAKTGQLYWTDDMESAMWGSPLIVDGHIYVTDEEGDVRIFQVAREMKMIAEHNLGSASYCSPVYANGVLYLTTRDHIYAIQNGAQSKPPQEQ
jgi:outer membrane protein assembly factor BamB